MDGDEGGLIEIYKKCDNLCYIRTHVEYQYTGSYLEELRDRERYTKAFFCDEYCRENRGNFYPCCMKELLQDKKIWSHIQKVGESYYKMIDPVDTIKDRWEVPSFYVPPEDYPDERIARRTVRKYLKAWQRLLDSGHNCEEGEVECSEF